MSKAITRSGGNLLAFSVETKNGKRNPHTLTTADYRRLLSELRLRPPSQRAFLRKLLNRAFANSERAEFLEASRVVNDPAGPS
jgi:hypothetical protein